MIPMRESKPRTNPTRCTANQKSILTRRVHSQRPSFTREREWTSQAFAKRTRGFEALENVARATERQRGEQYRLPLGSTPAESTHLPSVGSFPRRLPTRSVSSLAGIPPSLSFSVGFIFPVNARPSGNNNCGISAHYRIRVRISNGYSV